MRGYEGERVTKSARFIEIPLAVDHGGAITNRGECSDLCAYDGREEEEQEEEEEEEEHEREEFAREYERIYQEGPSHEANCERTDPFHDSSGESSQEASDSDDEDFIPDSSSEDESEIIRGRGARPPRRKSRLSWRRQCRDAQAKRLPRKAAPYEVRDVRRVVFAVIAEGLGYRQAVRFAALIGVVLPVEREFYRQLGLVAAEIVAMARESIATAYATMVAPETCDVDGTWSSRVRGTHCVFTVLRRRQR
jgi:hypothetical protein